jgi:hypothetical protein
MANAAERAVYVERHVDSNLKYIFADCELEPEVQYTLALAGYCKVRRMVGLGEDRRGVRARLRDQLALDADVDDAAAQRVASVLDAWEVAGKQQETEVSMRAEARALNLPRPVQQLERGAMRTAVEAVHGRKPDREVPGPGYISVKMREIENNDVKAARLEDMVSLSDDEDDGIEAGIDSSGSLQILRTSKKKLKPPQNTEELRTRLRVDCNVWMFGKTQHTNRRWLADLEPGTYETLIDYLCGDQVAKLVITVPGQGDDGSKELRLTPPWSLVLAYEDQLRKAASKSVTDRGVSLNQALKDAMTNTEIKEVYFTNPLALLPVRHDRCPAEEMRFVVRPWCSANDQVMLAGTCQEELEAAGGLQFLRDVAAAWRQLMAWDADQAARARDEELWNLRVEGELAQDLRSDSDSVDSGWHAGFDIDSDGHWIPTDEDRMQGWW